MPARAIGCPVAGPALWLAANEAALLAGFPTCISTRSAWPHQRRHGHCPVPHAGTNTGPMPVGPATGQTITLPAPNSSTTTPARPDHQEHVIDNLRLAAAPE